MISTQKIYKPEHSDKLIMLKNKKAQLFGLELHVFLIGFGIALAVIIIGIVVLKFMNKIPAPICKFVCNCAAEAVKK